MINNEYLPKELLERLQERFNTFSKKQQGNSYLHTPASMRELTYNAAIDDLLYIICDHTGKTVEELFKKS